MNEKIKPQLEYLQILTNFLNSDSYAFYRFLSKRRLASNILKENYVELANNYIFHNQHGINDRLWDLQNPKYRQRIQITLVRNISNYLSSLLMFIAYSQKDIEPYLKSNTEIYNRFEILKQNYLSSTKSHKFIKDLRNFTNHFSTISISSEISRNHKVNDAQIDIFVKKSDILMWDSWSKESKAYLDEQSEKIYLFRILKSHYEEFIKFQDKIYLYIFLVDEPKISKFKNEISETYCKLSSYTDKNIPLTKGYIKYIEKIVQKAHRTTKAFAQLGLTSIFSAFFHHQSVVIGWTNPKPPAIFATLLLRWLLLRSK